jgi:hypothetical protein
MVTLGLNHIGHVVSGLSAAVYHPERAKSAAPVLLTLFGFTPVQVELLIGGFLVAAQSANLTLRHVRHRLADMYRR